MSSSSSEVPSRDKAITVAIPIAPAVHRALVKEAGERQRELTEHIQRLLAEHVIEKGFVSEEDAARVKRLWDLVDRAVDEAKRICRDGGFTDAITLDAIRACMKDPKWVSDYREFVQDDIYKNGNPLKGPINREIGYRIRAGIGGKTVIANGKPAIARVLGEIIQSYTPMESFDPLVAAMDR